MEYRHFTHTHGLDFHQLQHGSEIQCSACKTPASGNVYVCWRCNYFLHERCYNASRSLKTSIHPLHPLTLVPYPTHQSSSFYCNSCNLIGTGLSYCCAACDFDLHIHCANLPYNPSPNHPFISTYPAHSAPVPTSFSLFPPSQNYHFSSNPNGVPGYPTPSAPQMPPPTAPYHQPDHPIPSYSQPLPPSCPPIASPPPPQSSQTNQNLPIYTPPAPSISVIAPPQPTTTLPTNTSTASNVSSGSSPTPPPVSQPNSDQVQPKPPSLIKHFSHPHVLLQMELDKKNPKVCSACECSLSGTAYCCTEGSCTFNLHKACFDSPEEVRHKCHLDHPLKLLTAPPYTDGFTCNACLKDGKAFAYHCEECAYDLHIDCITWPETVTRPDHKHVLNLYYSSPAGSSNQEVVFTCDVCNNPVHDMAWMYYCRECDYGTHLECVAAGLLPAAEAGQTEEDLLRETQLKFAVLQLLLSGGLTGAGK